MLFAGYRDRGIQTPQVNPEPGLQAGKEDLPESLPPVMTAGAESKRSVFLWSHSGQVIPISASQHEKTSSSNLYPQFLHL